MKFGFLDSLLRFEFGLKQVIIVIPESNWILVVGIWNDSNIWIDTELWKDS